MKKRRAHPTHHKKAHLAQARRATASPVYLYLARGWMFIVMFAVMLGIGAIVGNFINQQLNQSIPQVAGVETEAR